MIESLLTSFIRDQDLYLHSLSQTVQMVGISLSIAVLLGFSLGVLLVVTRTGHLYENEKLNYVLNITVNTLRSMPFIILMVAIMPVTKIISGTTIGVRGAIFPLVVYITPFITRLTESAMLEVDAGVIEAYKAMGATRLQIIFTVILKESLPGLVLGLTIATITLIGATAMAGVVGAGGLGDLALRYGYQRWEPQVMVGCVMILWFVIQSIQSFGNYFSKILRKK
jgi:D-methionine transport system permease protein